jgi:hypothetical protein
MKECRKVLVRRDDYGEGKKSSGEKLFQAKDIAHGIQPRGLLYDPFGGAEGTTGKGVAGMCAVNDFDPFTGTTEQNRMIADNVAGSDGLHTDFTGLAFPGDAMPGKDSHFF